VTDDPQAALLKVAYQRLRAILLSSSNPDDHRARDAVLKALDDLQKEIATNPNWVEELSKPEPPEQK
jgi:hypothetical protein